MPDKSAISVVISFLTVALIFSMSASTLNNKIAFVFAEPPDPCFEGNCNDKACYNDPAKLTATCCWTSSQSIKFPAKACQICHVQLPSGDYDCEPVFSEHKGGGGGAVNTQPTNIAPPKVCPDGSAPNADGKCPPVTQGDSGSKEKEKNPKSPTDTGGAGLAVSDEGAPGKKPVKK